MKGSSVVSGYLKLRQGTVRKVWKKLYFVVRGNDFYFFATSAVHYPSPPSTPLTPSTTTLTHNNNHIQGKERPLGHFTLNNSLIEDAKEEIKGEKHCIVITNQETKKSFALSAETKEEKARWVDELHRRQITLARHPSGRVRSGMHSAIF